MQLGGVAEGTARTAAKRSSLAEYPAKAVDGRSHVEALSSTLAAFGAAARKGIDQANELGDLDTADLFTEVSRGIDKWLGLKEFRIEESHMIHDLLLKAACHRMATATIPARRPSAGAVPGR